MLVVDRAVLAMQAVDAAEMLVVALRSDMLETALDCSRP